LETLIPRLPELVPIIPDAFVAKTQQIGVFLAARDYLLAARSADTVVCPESRYNILRIGHRIVSQEFSEHEGVLYGLAGAGALVRGRGVSCIPQYRDSRSAVARNWGVLENCPL